MLHPDAFDGSLISMPQPYRISELETRYRELLAVLPQQPDQPAALMPRLLNLATVDDRLHEVANAIAVMWLALEQPDKGLRLLRQAGRLAPEDPVIAHNLTVADTPGARAARPAGPMGGAALVRQGGQESPKNSSVFARAVILAPDERARMPNKKVSLVGAWDTGGMAGKVA